MSEKSYIKFHGWAVYGWKAHAIVELYLAFHVLLGVVAGYLLWGDA